MRFLVETRSNDPVVDRVRDCGACGATVGAVPPLAPPVAVDAGSAGRASQRWATYDAPALRRGISEGRAAVPGQLAAASTGAPLGDRREARRMGAQTGSRCV